MNITKKQHTSQMIMAMVSGAGPKMSGKAIFQQTCSRCHGPQGQGNPAADKFFKTAVPRLDSKFVQSKSDTELKDIISNGKGMMDPVRTGQASLQHVLPPDSVNAVVSYLRTLKH